MKMNLKRDHGEEKEESTMGNLQENGKMMNKTNGDQGRGPITENLKDGKTGERKTKNGEDRNGPNGKRMMMNGKMTGIKIGL